MEKTRISSGWKIAILGGCALVAVCGAAIFALMLAALISPLPDPVVIVTQEVPDPTVSDVLTGHRWRMHSSYLGDGIILEADFKEGGSFDGIITAPPNAYDLTPTYQEVSGKWNMEGDRLFLEWDWIWNGGPSHWNIPIEISSVSQYNLQGIYDGELSLSLWEFERID